MKKLKLPRSYYNYTSILGTLIAFIAASTLVFLTLVLSISDIGSVYTQLFTYLIVPGFLFTGLFLIALGMYIQGKKDKQNGGIIDDKKFVLDFKDEKTRNATIIFITVTIIFIFSTVVGSYKAYHYSESLEFCGTLCHKVMNPEYVAYQNSPHAKVKCAECHIGEGVDWFVKAKISGLRQVYRYMLDSYERPIATPIHNLRPARETCEKCHWPQKFYGLTLHEKKYFLVDSLNTEWDVLLNMKIGPSHQSQGFSQGIHWHINPDIKIEYTTNEKHDTIFTIKVTNLKTKKVTVYKDTKLDMAPRAKEYNKSYRTMDCMDCHNRPAHEYRTPSYYINNLIASNPSIAAIPWFKVATMSALKVKYKTRDSANAGIRKNIVLYYKANYPHAYAMHSKKIDAAIGDVIAAYAINAFPEMGADYSVYPRHIGHLESNGCFRCHNDTHKSDEGKTISKDCSICHSIVGQGVKGKMSYTTFDKQMDFQHPVDIDDAWKDTDCQVCHKELY